MEGGGVLAVPVVFLCLGSLGDVLPLLFVARAGAGAGSFITFITHALYQQRLAPYLLDPTIHFTALPFPPLPPPDAGPEHIQSELEACLDACKAALLLGGGDAHASRPPPPSPRRGLLCANLVAKFAWHIAEVLDVPFLLLAPSIPPPGPAPSAATIYALVGDDAVLQRLRLADRGRASDDAEDDDGDGIRYQRRPIGMAELGHWMLSLLLPPYREFRRRYVCLADGWKDRRIDAMAYTTQMMHQHS